MTAEDVANLMLFIIGIPGLMGLAFGGASMIFMGIELVLWMCGVRE